MKQNKQYNGIDCLKFLMALIIAALHSFLFDCMGDSYLDRIVKILTGLCVPTFFVISSFFFFRKVNGVNTLKEKFKHLLYFEKRIILLYLFWVILQMPFVIHTYHYHCWFDIIIFIKEFFLGSTFVASWYMGALITGIPIIFLLAVNKLYKILITILSIVLYISVYEKVDCSILVWYTENITNPILSFPRALLWLALGYYLSLIRDIKIPLIAYIVLLLAFWSISPFFPPEYIEIPIVVVLFQLAKNVSLHDSFIYRKFRIDSTIIYCSHGSVLVLVNYIFKPGILLAPITINYMHLSF